MSEIPADWQPIPGHTSLVRDRLKQLGARYDQRSHRWWIAPERLAEAERVVSEYWQGLESLR